MTVRLEKEEGNKSLRFLRHAYFKPIQSWVLQVGFQVLLPIFPSHKQFCTQNSVEKSMYLFPSVFSTSPLQPWKVIVCWEPTPPVFLVWNLQGLNVQMFLNILGAEPAQFLPFPSGCKIPYVKRNNSQAKCIAYQSASLIFPEEYKHWSLPRDDRRVHMGFWFGALPLNWKLGPNRLAYLIQCSLFG